MHRLTKAVIDTNVLIYDTFIDQEYHPLSCQTLNKLNYWYIPTIVFHEYFWVLKNLGTERNLIKLKVMEYLNHFKTIVEPINNIDIEFAINYIFENELSLKKYNDLLILSIAKRFNLPIFTFDKELIRIAKKLKIQILSINEE